MTKTAAVKPDTGPGRKGVQTSEFLWTAIGVALPILNKVFDLELPMESMYIIIAYILSRAGVKVAEIRKQPA